jgi:hypothetical protein
VKEVGESSQRWRFGEEKNEIGRGVKTLKQLLRKRYSWNLLECVLLGQSVACV